MITVFKRFLMIWLAALSLAACTEKQPEGQHGPATVTEAPAQVDTARPIADTAETLPAKAAWIKNPKRLQQMADLIEALSSGDKGKIRPFLALPLSDGDHWHVYQDERPGFDYNKPFTAADFDSAGERLFLPIMIKALRTLDVQKLYATGQYTTKTFKAPFFKGYNADFEVVGAYENDSTITLSLNRTFDVDEMYSETGWYYTFIVKQDTFRLKKIQMAG